MTVAALIAWSNAIPGLISAGVMVEGQIASVIKSFHSSMTDAQLNAIAAVIVSGAVQVQAIAEKDMGTMTAKPPVTVGTV